MGEWILTKDNLPELEKEVLICTAVTKEYFVGSLYFSKAQKKTMFRFEDYCAKVDEIVAWMEIPEFKN